MASRKPKKRTRLTVTEVLGRITDLKVLVVRSGNAIAHRVEKLEKANRELQAEIADRFAPPEAGPAVFGERVSEARAERPNRNAYAEPLSGLRHEPMGDGRCPAYDSIGKNRCMIEAGHPGDHLFDVDVTRRTSRPPEWPEPGAEAPAEKPPLGKMRTTLPEPTLLITATGSAYTACEQLNAIACEMREQLERILGPFPLPAGDDRDGGPGGQIGDLTVALAHVHDHIGRVAYLAALLRSL